MQLFKQYSNQAYLSILTIALFFVMGCGGSNGSTDAVAPITMTTVPATDATNVNLNSNISVLFSEALDPATVTSATVVLTEGGKLVTGVVSYHDNNILFAPETSLSADTQYTVTITTGVTDLAGNALASDYVLHFTTGSTMDESLPMVTSTGLGIDTTNVSLNGSISVLFDEALDPTTVTSTSVILAEGGVPIAGVVSYYDNTIFFNPNTNLSADTQYTATITTGVTDLAGNALASDYILHFTTGSTIDDSAPTVVSIDPSDDATNVPYNKSISTLFSEALDPNSVTTAAFTLIPTGGNKSLSGKVSYYGKSVVFDPDANLSANTQYTATITTGVTDLAGNAIASEYVWTFTTGAIPVSVLAPVNLGMAGSYVILAKTGISTTGTTHITGDIGVSPVARTYITGFSDTLFSDGTYAISPLVTGKIYAANMAVPTPTNMTTAISNMETAYTDAAGRTLPDYTELHAGDVSGKILTPGLYKWGTGVLITDQGVTISGSATDIWIFQISGDLTVSSGAIITLAGGALAKNIFWQVAGGTGVSLGTTSDFKGIVLAQKGIVVSTGASVRGRLLVQTAVTLDANAVTKP